MSVMSQAAPAAGRHFRTTFFHAVGDAKRVRIYKFTLRRICRWIPVFETTREFHCTAKFAQVPAVLSQLNGGPLPRSIAYAEGDYSIEAWLDDQLFDLLYGEEDGQTSQA